MAEQLQSLLDRIQKDGIDKAQLEAARIVAEAQQRASAIVRDAEASAASVREQAEQAATAAAARGKVALQQAARDVVIALADAINRALNALVGADVRQALSPDTMGRMIEAITAAYVHAPAGQHQLQVLLPPAQQQAVLDYGKARLAAALREGLSIKGDSRVIAGFRVAVTGQHLEHDFTEPAITAALCELVRPHVAAIVREAAKPA